MLGRTVASVILLFLALGSVGCASKAMTKPRSELIEDARQEGVELPSAEEERAAFFAVEEEQKERVLSLIRQRAQTNSGDPSYIIGPQDEIEVNVFDVPELNLTAKVNQSGLISLPLVGAVPAAGYTEGMLKDLLTERLTAYVRNPQVTLAVSHYGSQKVAVMGAVQKPGTYSLKKGSNSMLELISQAGGVNSRAGNYLNFIPTELSGLGAANDAEARARLALDAGPNGLKGAQPLEIYLDRVMGTSGGVPLEIPVRGGDMIVIPEAGKVMVEGEVEKPGSYELGQQMTLLGALAASGGITYGAKFDEVEVVRELTPGSKGRLLVDLERIAQGEEVDLRLRNGDIVRVPSDSGRRMTQDTFEGITRIINFGVGGSVNLAP